MKQGDGAAVLSLVGRFKSAELVLLEFSGLKAGQRFDAAFPADEYPAIPRWDPLTYFESGLPGIDAKIGSLADAIAGSGARRVRLAASCSGVALLGPLAAGLSALGLRVVELVAVDPYLVRPRDVRSALQRIAAGLGITDAVPEAPPDERSVRAMISAWINEFAGEADMDPVEQALFQEGLFSRYLGWVDYLLWAASGVKAADGHDVMAFGVKAAPRVDEILADVGEVSELRYESTGTPLLLRADVIADIRKHVT